MTAKSRSVINAEADANIQDNTAQEITPADVRQRIKDLADSSLNPSNDKDASDKYAGLTLFKINFKNALNTFTSFFTNSNTASRTYTFQNRDGTIADDTDLAGKRGFAVRVGTEVSNSATAINVDLYDQWNITALAVTDTIGAPTGTPADGQNLIIRVKDNGTPQSLLWDPIFRSSSDLSFPSITIVNKTLYAGVKYNSAATKWDLIALLNNF